MNKMVKTNLTIAILCLLGTNIAIAQNLDPADRAAASVTQMIANSATLKKIKETGLIKVGVRQVAPVSYDVRGKASGYAIDICNSIIEQIKINFDVRHLRTEYIPVSAQQRMPAIQNGFIDLECGITTNNADRRAQAAFSIPHYVTGTKLLMLKTYERRYSSVNDLTGDKIATVKGTTAVSAIDTLNKQRLLDIENVQHENYEEALASLISGKVKAVLLDELILEDLKAKSPNSDNLFSLPTYVTMEPLSIMMRKEKVLQDFVNREMRKMYKNGQIEQYHNKWFKRPVPPDNINYNIDINQSLRELIRMPNDIVGN